MAPLDVSPESRADLLEVRHSCLEEDFKAEPYCGGVLPPWPPWDPEVGPEGLSIPPISVAA